VERGEVLAVLDADDLSLQAQAAQAQLAAAEADLVRTRGDRDRFAALVKDRLVSQSAYDAQVAAYEAAAGQARAARAQLDVSRNQAGYAQLRAPRDGVIASRQAEVGQVVAAGQTVFTLAAKSGREVLISLPEGRVREFEVGQPVTVELWNAPGRRLPGEIREISPAADPQTRTYAARVALPDNAARAVELGQSARVYVQDTGARAALSVPLSAVQRGAGGATAVWVVDAGGKVRSQPVRLGAFGEDSVPVLSGLRQDQWVVASGGHLLREGQAVSPVDRDNRPVGGTAQASGAAAAQRAR
ncbi:MAG TPA: efflux RND transporter periplasmic adaptor subunit, partial [Pseudoxanthomonas sp.]|nr:efflux RND transporter periplasmic adaptor subunit [Pseudoxanthomonas sp.]